MRDCWIRRFVLLLFLLPLSAVPEPSWADSDTSLNEAIERFVEGQRLRIRTCGHSMIWGRFLRAVPDSIYIDLLSMGTETSSNRRAGGSIEMVGIEHTEVDVIWKVGRGGMSRGFLYAGGAALAGTVFLFSSKTLEESISISIVTIVAVPIAFVWGALSKKETLVYSRTGY